MKNHQEWSNYINTAKCSTSQRHDALNQKNRKEGKLFNDINDYMIKVIQNYEVKKDLLNQNDKKYLQENLEIIKSYWKMIKNGRNNISAWDNYTNNSNVASTLKNKYILKKNTAEEKFYDDMKDFLSTVDNYVDECIKRTIHRSQNTSKKYYFDR